MRVTIFADASVKPTPFSAGWACWIKSDALPQSVALGRPFKDPIVTSNTAYYEAAALANALTVATAVGAVGAGFTVMLQSDSLTALNVLAYYVPGAQPRPHPSGANIFPHAARGINRALVGPVEHVRGLLAGRGAILHLRHVRGHKNGPERQWVNRLCDDLAKRARVTNAPVTAEDSPLWVRKIR